MSLNRVLPSLRAPARLLPRQFSSSISVRNSSANDKSAEVSQATLPITESHRQDVFLDGTVRAPKQKRQQVHRKAETRSTPRQSTQSSETTDFFDGASSSPVQTLASRVSKISGSDISADLLSSEEFSEIKDKQKAKPKVKSKGLYKEGGDLRGARMPGQGGRRFKDGKPLGQGQGGRDASASGSGSRGGPGPGGRTGGARKDGPPRERAPRRDDVKPSVSVARGPKPASVANLDTTYDGLFGLASLISPARRGAREAGMSFWAKEIAPADARKTDLMRLAGSYDLRLPTTPFPSTLPAKASAVEKAKAAARWTFSANPTIPLRARDPGVEVVDRLLR